METRLSARFGRIGRIFYYRPYFARTRARTDMLRPKRRDASEASEARNLQVSESGGPGSIPMHIVKVRCHDA
jgi:hypothetical protein